MQTQVSRMSFKLLDGKQEHLLQGIDLFDTK